MDILTRQDVVAQLLTWRSAATLVLIWVIYRIIRAAYNVSPFHPLAQFPGPKIAAASYLYEFYFDVVKWGRYSHEIKRLHDLYGPIIRINPDELHCNDHLFTEEIYAVGGRKRNKPHHQLAHLVGPNALSGFATEDHDLHRRRRAPLTKIFSRAQIARLEFEIHVLVQQICDKLLAQSSTEAFDVTEAYSCFTSDLISGYCFGEAFGFLQQPAFQPNFRRAAYSFLNTMYIFRYFGFLKILAVAVPFISGYLSDDVDILVKATMIDIPNRIKKTRADLNAGIVGDRETVLASMFQSDMPPEEKSVYRLSGEASLLLAAGTETTSWTLSVITFYLLTHREMRDRLTAELNTVVQDSRNLPPWFTLEALPYLTAVIHEGLRLSYGVSSRTSRIPTEEDLVYHGSWSSPSDPSTGPSKVDYVIPRGTAIGMSPAIMHHKEDVFRDSEQFLPDRWLDEKGQRRRDLERWLMSFSKGSRQCLGMNLAYCELYLAVTALVLRVYPHMQLYRTAVLDVKYDYDLFVPMVKKGSQGVRVLIKETRDSVV